MRTPGVSLSALEVMITLFAEFRGGVEAVAQSAARNGPLTPKWCDWSTRRRGRESVVFS